MNINVDQSVCDLFRGGKFTECSEILQKIFDNYHLDKISLQDEVEFIILRNNLLICNCLVCILKLEFDFLNLFLNYFNCIFY